MSKVSDFNVNGSTFEAGGRKNEKRQTEGTEKGSIVRDDIETGHGIVIPPWHFGMTC